MQERLLSKSTLEATVSLLGLPVDSTHESAELSFLKFGVFKYVRNLLTLSKMEPRKLKLKATEPVSL